MHDMKVPLSQLFQKTGQSGDGCGVNVVEQQNAFAARLKPVHCQRNDFLRRDAVMPVIRHGVRTKVNEYPELCHNPPPLRAVERSEERRQGYGSR
jgi:hypothetical protein